ncbi:MAG: type II secretion system F family protein [Bacteroidota bacterium]
MPSIDLSRYEKKKTAKTSPLNTGDRLSAFFNQEINLGGSGLADQKKEFMYLELGSLLTAGIDFSSAIELITSDQQKEKDKLLFKGIQKQVLEGMAFSTALAQTGKFSLYETYSLQIGEETGKLIEVLHDLAAFFKNKIKQRRTIISSLTYPVIVLTTSLGAVFFMLKFVVPMFGDIFKRFGGELPWITQQIMAFSNAVQTGFLPFLLLISIGAAIVFRYRNTIRFRRVTSAALLKVPIIGNIVQKIYLARFSNSMRLLINAKLPLLRSIALCRQMIGYYPIQSSLEQVEQSILGGGSLHESLQRFKIYPPKMIQLLKVGEETNQLDYFFGWVADQYTTEVEHKTATLSNALQPLIIIFLGAIVAVILISMYLPLFQMSDHIQ